MFPLYFSNLLKSGKSGKFTINVYIFNYLYYFFIIQLKKFIYWPFEIITKKRYNKYLKIKAVNDSFISRKLKVNVYSSY